MQEYDVIVVGAGNAALSAAVSAHENGAARVLVLEKAPRDMRGGNTHWAGAVLRIAFDDPHDLAPLLPGIEREYESFYEGITPYTRKDYMDDLLRVTSGRTDPLLSRILVDNSKDTVFWMHEVGGVKMEPAITVAGVKKGNMVVWPRGLVVRAVHEGVGLSRTWFATAGQARHRDPLFQRRHRADPRRPRPHRRRQGARAGRARGHPCQGRRARLRRLRGQRADAHAAHRPAGRRRQGARHAAQPGRRVAHGDGDRRHAVGAMERLPRHADQRRLGRLRAARIHRPLKPTELSLRPDDQPQGPSLRRRGRGPEPLHLRQVRPRDPGRAGCQGVPAVRQQGAAPAGAALFDVEAHSCGVR